MLRNGQFIEGVLTSCLTKSDVRGFDYAAVRLERLFSESGVITWVENESRDVDVWLIRKLGAG